MDRVKRFAYQILEMYKDTFTDDFEKNKEVLSKVTIIRSKQLRNEVAGFITKSMSFDEDEETSETVNEALTEPAKI